MSRWFEQRAKQLLFRSLSGLRGGFLEIVCPDETYSFGDPAAPLRAMAVIHDERFFSRAITGADIGIGESYMDGDWTSPDPVALVRLCVRNLRSLDSRHKILSAVRAFSSRVRHRLRANTMTGSRENIRAHYDLGNDFYRLFLDEQMMYSSAYYRSAEDSLEQAQTQKIDLICRKLQLEPGDRVLEIGCGWGGFALYAARHYDEYFGTCDRLLAHDGSMLLQTITFPEQEVRAYRKRVDWIQTYIFPGSELASLAEIQRSLARCTQLGMAHTETFGVHYAKTLAAWRERFFQQLEAVRRLGFDERFQRMWDFYLAWCEGAFRERYINVAQLVLAKMGTQRPILGDPAGSESRMRSDSISH